jgi:cysteinyl-tRNA synthetase
MKKQKIPIKLFNTMGRKKQTFKPLKPGLVRMYTCGPTVYDYAHLGHFRAYVFVDVLKRMLKFNGLHVKQVMNITDVGHLTSDADTGEDKIEKKAREERKSAWKIAEFYTKDFFDAMHKLNVQDAEKIPKATDHIRDMIEFVKKIEANGYTYRTKDGIYFDTSKLPSYGRLAGLDKKKIKELKAGARVEFREKRNVTDFALWKFSPKDEKRQMEWKSPWGIGFPGWHLECSVMGIKYLGERFDIHTGGIDHIAVHHTNEIAQAEAVTGKNPVNFWLHNNFVMVNGEKMAKSKRNFYTMKDIESRGLDSLALRYLFLTAHYRSKMNFTWKSLKAAERALTTLREHMLKLKGSDNVKTKKDKMDAYRKEFLKAVNDDLNTSNALKVLWKLVRQEKNVSNRDKRKLILEFDKVLGLQLKDVKAERIRLPRAAKELINEREKARKKKDFAKADKIRKQLEKEFGIILEDTPKGVEWKRKK